MESLKSKLVGVALAAGILVSGGALAANAGDHWSNYNTTVGKFNGNGYTGTQKKAIAGAAGELRSKSVGGKYVVDARLQRSNGKQSGQWARRVNSGTRASLYNSLPAGARTRVQFSNNISTTVDVQVSGTWRSR